MAESVCMNVVSASLHLRMILLLPRSTLKKKRKKKEILKPLFFGETFSQDEKLFPGFFLGTSLNFADRFI